MRIAMIALLALGLTAGCNRKTATPAGRMEQPSGGFSFVTPDGWYRSKPVGMDFVIVSTEPDYGVSPNIFVEFVRPGTDFESSLAALTNRYARNHRKYEIVTQNEFFTKSGLPGIRMFAHRESLQNQSLTTIHYLISIHGNILGVTCTCAQAVEKNYIPLFDQAIATVEALDF